MKPVQIPRKRHPIDVAFERAVSSALMVLFFVAIVVGIIRGIAYQRTLLLVIGMELFSLLWAWMAWRKSDQKTK